MRTSSRRVASPQPPSIPRPQTPAPAHRAAWRVDRKSLTADDSQRDILAQKLLLEAEEALAERDSVAAMSLATKASTLLAPFLKLADSSVPSAP